MNYKKLKRVFALGMAVLLSVSTSVYGGTMEVHAAEIVSDDLLKNEVTDNSSLDENKENYVIKITDTSDIKQVDIQLRGQNKTITPEAGKKELKYKLKLKAGDENYLEVTAQNTEGISSGTRKIKYKKQ